jgi:hypothetical protein
MIDVYSSAVREDLYMKDLESARLGFGPTENGKFAWMIEEEASVYCRLYSADCTLVITQGALIPLDELGIDEYPVRISVNGEELAELVIDSSNNGANLYVDIPKEMLRDGENIISFESELWSPSDYGASDDRRLGFALSELHFVPKEVAME